METPPPGAETIRIASGPRSKENLAVFVTAWNTIQSKYYDPGFNGVDWSAQFREFADRASLAPDEKTLYRVLNEMLGRLKDGHVGAIPPGQARIVTSGQYAGIGLRTRMVEGRYVIGMVSPGGAADRAGIVPGWAVLTRDGLPFEEAVASPLRAGQVANWVFEDLERNRVEMKLTAASVSTLHREARLLPEGVAYVRFDQFNFDSMDWLRDRMAEYREAPALVLDLRENPGGMVGTTLYALGHFLGEDEIVAVMFGRGEDRSRWTPYGRPSEIYRGRVAVLVSEDSVSASEVLAAILQERGRAIVVGQKTAGSVLAASLVPLPDGGLLEYSSADLLTARGVRLEGRGVTPDLLVPAAPGASPPDGRDPGLSAAVEALLK